MKRSQRASIAVLAAAALGMTVTPAAHAAEMTVDDVRVSASSDASVLRPFEVGGKATVRGLLEFRQADGSWRPGGSQPIELHYYREMENYSLPIPNLRTAPDGTFSTTQPVTADGSFRACFGIRTVSSVDTRCSDDVRMDVGDLTVFSGLKLRRETHSGSSSLTGETTLIRPRLTGFHRSVARAAVNLNYSSDGKQWDLGGGVFLGKTSDAGRLSWGRIAKNMQWPLRGYWRLEYVGYSPNSSPVRTDLRALSRAFFFDLRRTSKISPLRVSPKTPERGARFTISGSVLGGYFPAKGGRAVYWYKPKGAKTWQQAGQQLLRHGAFKMRFKATKDGHWKVSFPGHVNHLPSSRTTYININ
ncbi:hypothetical protein GCM10027589_36680 [Actinocorallia lasiicapitis]